MRGEVMPHSFLRDKTDHVSFNQNVQEETALEINNESAEANTQSKQRSMSAKQTKIFRMERNISISQWRIFL